MLTTDSIDPSVKYFFFLIDSIDTQSQNPCQTDYHQSIGSLLTDGIDLSVKNRFPYHHFEGEPSKYSSTIGCARNDGLKGLCQNICCCKLLK
jgi:hypothetical protein